MPEDKQTPWGALGMQAAGQVTGGLIGLATGGIENKRQLKQQGKLQNLQIKGMKEMGEYNYGQQMKLWNNTNYSAQMEQLKKAGLNAGLIYGMSGGGGATAAASGGSGVSGATAQGAASGQMQEGMGMMMQMQLLKAQKENIEADTRLKETTATKTGGVDTENVKANTVLTKVEGQIKELDLTLANETYRARTAIIKQEAEQSFQELEILRNDATVSANTWDAKIQMVGAELIGLQIRNELSKAQTEKTWSDIKVNNAQIENWLVQNAQGWTKLSQDERNTKVNELLAGFNTSLVGHALGIVGNIVNTVVGKIGTKGTVVNAQKTVTNTFTRTGQ